MRRLPVRMLLLGCAGVLLGMQGCSRPTVVLSDDDPNATAARLAGQGTKGKAAPAEGADGPFRLPGDAAGVLLARVLPPTPPAGALPNRTRPAPRTVPAPRLAGMVVRLPEVVPDLPRLPEVLKKAPPRPELVHEEALEESFNELEPPQKHTYATEKLTRVDSADAALPPPLPVMAQPTTDRVSLDDATTEVSTLAILSAALPERETPAPYQRMTLPEPYENHQPLTVSLPPESEEPEAAAPTPPKP